MKNNVKKVRIIPVNIAICDDNPLFTKDLYELIYTCCAKKDWSCKGLIFTSPQRLLAADLSETQIAFLDIDMPLINGLEVAKELRQRYPELIIVFATQYVQYALDGYCVNAFRYLLKSRIEKQLEECMDAIEEKLYEDKETITVQQKDRFEEIAINDIVLFAGTDRRAVLLYTRNKTEAIECSGKLGDYEERLKEKGFLRLQKSYLANMRHIEKISNYKAKIRNGMEIKVSEKNYPQISRTYTLWRGQKL